MTGGCSAHPLLISLANISMEFQNKDLNNAYLLLALLPIPKFIHHKKPICGMLEAHLYHHCLDIVFAPLKSTAQLGVMLSDPLRNLRWCFTPLVSIIYYRHTRAVLYTPPHTPADSSGLRWTQHQNYLIPPFGPLWMLESGGIHQIPLDSSIQTTAMG